MCQVHRTPPALPYRCVCWNSSHAQLTLTGGISGFGAMTPFFNGRVNSRPTLECPVRVTAKTVGNPLPLRPLRLTL